MLRIFDNRYQTFTNQTQQKVLIPLTADLTPKGFSLLVHMILRVSGNLRNHDSQIST